MSIGGQNEQQLQQDLKNEIFTAHQLLRLISEELQQIKDYTSAGGKFESIIKHNASLMSTLANLKQIDLDKIPAMVRKHIDMSPHENHNEEHSTYRNESEMDVVQ